MMARDAESSGDPGDWQLYERARRLLTSLFTLTHAIKYVRINTEERYKWAHASDAERLLHELFMYTRVTANGKKIWCDRFMEWIVRDIREREGKHFTWGKKDSIAATMHNITDLVRLRGGIKTEEQRVREQAGKTMTSEEAKYSQRRIGI